MKAFCFKTILVTSVLIPSLAMADPTGGQVIQGQATISSPTQNQTQILQQSNKALIEWQSFDIDTNERVDFIQPSTDSIALNRVVSGQETNILGQLSANGNVWVINPNGVVFGSESKIDTGGLLASTLDIRNEDFAAGNFEFFGANTEQGAIINEGTITVQDGGMVVLTAPSVKNSGVISARLGQVSLASTQGYTFDFYGDGKIKFLASDTSQNNDQFKIENTGEINADGGRIYITASAAKGVVDSVINLDGLVRAQTVTQAEGRIFIDSGDHGRTVVTGTIDASGKDNVLSEGGEIEITGNEVTLTSSAVVDVSGQNGGGVARIGGDFAGGGTLRRSDHTFIEGGALIQASALNNGNGGRVSIWANDETIYAGQTFANGLGEGLGGFVETSALQDIIIRDGEVSTFSESGDLGLWLIDPENITEGVFSVGQNSAISLVASNAITINELELSSGSSFSANAGGAIDIGLVEVFSVVGPVGMGETDSRLGTSFDEPDIVLTAPIVNVGDIRYRIPFININSPIIVTPGIFLQINNQSFDLPAPFGAPFSAPPSAGIRTVFNPPVVISGAALSILQQVQADFRKSGQSYSLSKGRGSKKKTDFFIRPIKGSAIGSSASIISKVKAILREQIKARQKKCEGSCVKTKNTDLGIRG